MSHFIRRSNLRCSMPVNQYDRTLHNKIRPAVSQKELEKFLNADLTPHETNRLSRMKARIEIIADFEDLKKINEFLRKGST